jgi:hypothetical protein
MIRFFLVIILLIFGSFLFQQYVPPILLLKGVSILLAPGIYFYSCLAFPFPLVLAITVLTGLVRDLLVVPEPGRSDFPLGASILIWLVPGLIVHGLRPLFLRNRWTIHLWLAEVCALLTPFILVAEYAILSFERRELFISDVILWRIFGPGLIAIFLNPCLFFILTPLSHWLNYRPGLSRTAP